MRRRLDHPLESGGLSRALFAAPETCFADSVTLTASEHRHRARPGRNGGRDRLHREQQRAVGSARNVRQCDRRASAGQLTRHRCRRRWRSTAGPDLVTGGTGFLRLGSAGHSIPSIAPQGGDLFRIDEGQLFYTTATALPTQIINLIGTVGGLVLLATPVRSVDTRLPGADNGTLQPGTVRPFSLASTTTGETAVPEGSRARS